MVKPGTEKLERLLDFIYEDVSALGEEEKAGFYGEFAADLLLHFIERPYMEEDQAKSALNYYLERAEGVRSVLKKYFHEIVGKHDHVLPYEYKPMNLSPRIETRLEAPLKLVYRKTYKYSHPEDAAVDFVMTSLDGVPWDWIAQCTAEGCERYFLTRGKKKRFCSPRCQTRAFKAKKRAEKTKEEKEKEASEDRELKRMRYRKDEAYQESKKADARKRYRKKKKGGGKQTKEDVNKSKRKGGDENHV